MRNIIRSNPSAYQIITKMRFSRNLRLADERTDLVIEGFPRSGNTFSRKLVELAFPEVNLASHVHAVAALKSALFYKKPTILLLRNPVDCVASWSCKNYVRKQQKIESFVRQAINDYVTMNAFALEYMGAISVVLFDDLIEKPEEFLTLCACIMKKPIPVGLESVPVRVKNLMQEKERAKDPMGSSLPSQAREIYKLEMAELVRRIPAYGKADKVFHALKGIKQKL